MNIISNSCIGSAIYELSNEKFNNPFMWNVIPYNDFKYIITNYGNIDFKKYNLYLYESNNDKTVKVVFDNIINVYYIHYHYGAKDINVVKRSPVDIYYKDILDYTKDKINTRIERLQDNEDPIFIFETRPRKRFNADYNEKDIIDFINLDTKYTRILITSFDRFKDHPDKIGNCYIIYYHDRQPHSAPDIRDMAKVIYNKLKMLFKK